MGALSVSGNNGAYVTSRCVISPGARVAYYSIGTGVPGEAMTAHQVPAYSSTAAGEITKFVVTNVGMGCGGYSISYNLLV